MAIPTPQIQSNLKWEVASLNCRDSPVFLTFHDLLASFAKWPTAMFCKSVMSHLHNSFTSIEFFLISGTRDMHRKVTEANWWNRNKTTECSFYEVWMTNLSIRKHNNVTEKGKEMKGFKRNCTVQDQIKKKIIPLWIHGQQLTPKISLLLNLNIATFNLQAQL